jgi:DNA (cytosine-5)-methyltransferase 1
MTWTHLDLFSGIGGFALAAAWTGRIQTVQFVELDPWCRRVLAKHWPEVPIHDDIRTFLADARRSEPQESDGAAWSGTEDGTRGELSALLAAGTGASGGVERGHLAEGIRRREPIDPQRPAFLADTTQQPTGEPDDEADAVATGWQARSLFGERGHGGRTAAVSDLGCERSQGSAARQYAAEQFARSTGTHIPLDLLTGGFPCQPWSAAGKQRGVADDRDLWPELHRLVVSLRPRWCLFENVSGLVGMEGGLDRVLTQMEESGYATGTVVIPAAAVGAYHRRDRVWIVAHDDSLSSDRGAEPGLWGASRTEYLSPALVGDVAHAADGGLRRGFPLWEPGLAAQRGEDAAHADEQGEPVVSANGRTGRGQLWARDAADGGSIGLEGEQPGGTATGATVGSGCRDETLSAVGRGVDGLPRGLARSGPVRFGPDWEAGIPRVTTHEADRVNKLKALGNAIVPAVAYELMLMLLEVDALPTAALGVE